MINVLILFCYNLFLVHDFHTSLAEFSFNSKTKSIEISLRVFTDDLELAINKIAKSPKILKIEDDKATIDPLIETYIKKNLALVSSQKDVKLLRFYGKEKEADATWIYAEFEECQKIGELSIYNAVFQDMYTDQTNIVNITDNTIKKTIVFDSKTKLAIWPY